MSQKIVAIVAPSLGYVAMMEEMGYKVLHINRIEDTLACANADLVLYTGGADINPALYGHTMHPTTGTHEYYDELYLAAFKVAQVYGTPQVGICRGSQFLCAMAGGTLIQDCKGHAVMNGHEVQTNWGETFHVTSTHHQMQYPDKAPHTLLAWGADIGYNKQQHIGGKVVEVMRGVDAEVVFYPDIKALAFQPHPEFQAGSCRDLFIKCMDLCITPLLENK